jgi:hypothetical protein
VEWLNKTMLELVGWAGGALLVISLLQARVLRFRVLNLAACLVLIAYNGFVGVWPMFGMNIVLSLINVWFIVQLLRTRHDETTYAVIEVSATDAYLQHFLGIHGDDIAKHHPSSPPVQAGDLAYQVLKGDETVGVIILRRDGDVIWRTTEGLHQRGFRKVVTPPDMVAPYYESLDVGFRREDRSFVLDL